METMLAIGLLDVAMVMLIAVVLVMALAFVLRGFSLVIRHMGNAGEGAEDAKRAMLEVAKERVFENLRDLEMDYAMRKIGDADYKVLKAQSEKQAVKVMREIDEMEARGIHRRFMWIALVGLGCCLSFASPTEAWAQAMPPGHPDIGMSQRGNTVASIENVFIRVLKVTREGVLEPFGNAPVLVEMREEQPGPMGEANVLGTDMLRTDERGSSVLPMEVHRNRSLRAYVPYGNAVFSADWVPTTANTGRAFLLVFVYETTYAWDDLALEVVASLEHSQWRDREQNLFVAEGQLSVRVQMTIRNDGSEAVDLRDPKRPFFLPLIAPVVGERVLAGGWWPDAAGKHIKPSFRASPHHGELSLEEGGIIYRGLVLPGRQTEVNFGYPLDIVAADTELGMVSHDLPIERMVVALQMRADVAATIRFDQETHLRKQEELAEDGRSLRVYVLEGVLEPGEPIRMVVTNLPVAGEYTQQASAWIVFFVLMAFAIALIRITRAPKG